MTCLRLHKSSVAEPGTEPSSATDIPWLQSDPFSKDLHIATWWDDDTFLWSDGRFNNLCVTTSTKQGSTYFFNLQILGTEGQAGGQWGGRTWCLQNGGGVGLGDSSSHLLTNITFLCLKDGMNWVCKNVSAKKK